MPQYQGEQPTGLDPGAKIPRCIYKYPFHISIEKGKVQLHFSTGRGGDFVESAGIFLGLTSLKIFMQNGIPSFSLEYRKCRFFFWSAKKRIKKSARVLN